MENNSLPITSLALRTVESHKKYFASGITLSYEFRYKQLSKFESLMKANESAFSEALHKDFRKSPFEAFATEIALVSEEIKYLKKHLAKLMRPTRVFTPIAHQPGRSYELAHPYGNVLVIAPWNYPVQLSLIPIVGAIAAGNTVVLKPSELAPHTSQLITKLMHDNFPVELITCFEGDAETSKLLLELPFNYIFFTGSPQVGKYVYQKAAEQLIPITLELGGKSPAIIDDTVDIKKAVKRIVWGKCVNAGQTCVAPDYVLVKRSVRDSFIDAFKQVTEEFYGEDPSLSPDYPRIINERHYKRITKLMNDIKILAGGRVIPADLYIEPTLLEVISLEHQVMKEEIFGPLLPMITYQEDKELAEIIGHNPNPLALYLFSKSNKLKRMLIEDTSFGSGCINDTIIQFANANFAVGGVGNSGIGAYHGKRSFDTFSHKKAIINRSFWFDLPLRYPPYAGKLQWVKKVIG